jgi:hypothetical protein
MWKILKKITPLEIFVLVIFAIYLIFDIQMPSTINQLIDTPLGIVVVLILTLSVFIYTNPVLGVLAIFVAYELIRRSSSVSNNVAMIQYNPIQIKVDNQMAEMNKEIHVPVSVSAPREPTLEEEVVQNLAPVVSGTPSSYVETSFRPVAEDLHNASKL